jgi:hypothetical protein
MQERIGGENKFVNCRRAIQVIFCALNVSLSRDKISRFEMDPQVDE